MNIYSVYWIRRQDHNDPYKQGYVGISCNVEQRLKKHTKGRKTIVSKALHKYDDIVVDVLFESVSKDDAMMLERDYRPSEKIGWNICAGGGIPPSKKGTKQRQDVKDKISAAHKGRTKSDEHLRNISQALKGKPSGHLGKKRKIVTCPHCHKSGGINTMTQWHFDKCKLNNRRS